MNDDAVNVLALGAAIGAVWILVALVSWPLVALVERVVPSVPVDDEEEES